MMRKRILIVDDESDIVRTIQLSLETNDYEVITAVDGREALDEIYNRNPDLIILDVMLPDIDGYELSRRLKDNQRHKNIPIMILTARAQKLDQKLWRRSKADLWMVKPFDLNVFMGNIQKLLGDRTERS